MADREAEEILARRAALGGLPRDLLDVLLASGDRADYPPAPPLSRARRPRGRCWSCAGCSASTCPRLRVRQVTVRYARPADVLGVAVLVGGPADVGCTDVGRSSLFRLDTRTLTAAAKRDARVSWALAEELNRRLYESLQQTAVNAFGSVRQRVATHLLDLASAQQRPSTALVARVTSRNCGRRRFQSAKWSPGYCGTSGSRAWSRPARQCPVLDPAGLQAQRGAPA